jgi:hypothetical protein
VRSPFCEGHTYFGPFWPLEADRAESVLSQGLDPWTQSLLSSVFTQVRGIEILRTSPFGPSQKFAAFRGFYGKLASPGMYIADSSPLTMVVVG